MNIVYERIAQKHIAGPSSIGTTSTTPTESDGENDGAPTNASTASASMHAATAGHQRVATPYSTMNHAATSTALHTAVSTERPRDQRDGGGAMTSEREKSEDCCAWRNNSFIVIREWLAATAACCARLSPLHFAILVVRCDDLFTAVGEAH